MKAAEDERFRFRFTFIDIGREKAFVTHYRPKHLPISSELSGVFKYLGLRDFKDCPEFDFEPCFFSTWKFVPRGDDMWGGNVNYSHRAFDAHATQFSPGIQSLLAANAAIEIGWYDLPFTKPAGRIRADIASKVVRPAKLGTTSPVTAATGSKLSSTVALMWRYQLQERKEGTRESSRKSCGMQDTPSSMMISIRSNCGARTWLFSLIKSIVRMRAFASCSCPRNTSYVSGRAIRREVRRRAQWWRN
jgi:hypothetical protein